jgi:hypothetical protein
MNSVTDFTDSQQRFFALSRLSPLPETIEEKLLFLAAGARSQPNLWLLLDEKKRFLEKLSLLKELNAQVEKLKESNAKAPTELNAKALIKLDLQVRAQIKLNAEALTKFFLYELLPFRLSTPHFMN